MINYLKKLANDFENALEEICGPDEESKCLEKIHGKLIPGARCFWTFNDDVEFWKSERTLGHIINDPTQWNYEGFIIPFPETYGRSEMEPEEVCVVIVDYPIEKENPVTDWVTLAQLLTQEDLYQFHIINPKK